MLVLGIDVIILAIAAICLTLTAYAVSVITPLTREEGEVCIISTAVASASMVIMYIIMARVLDSMLGL